MTPAVAEGLVQYELPEQQATALGGRIHHISQLCVLAAKIQGRWVQTHARVVDEIGKDDHNQPIEIIFGALAMREWGIELDLQHERLDLRYYPSVFVEFSQTATQEEDFA